MEDKNLLILFGQNCVRWWPGVASRGWGKYIIYSTWIQGLGVISLLIFPPWFKFDDFFFLSSRFWWSNFYKILHMTQHLCCHDMCKYLWWHDQWEWNYSTSGPLNKNYEETRQIWGIWKLRLAYSPETPNLGQNRWCFVPCDLEIWWMTLENNRASLLCCFKLCATFHSHRWIQTGVTFQKRPI